MTVNDNKRTENKVSLCRNDKIRAKRAENKVKQSVIENNLYSQLVNVHFALSAKFAMTVNMMCRNDNKGAEKKVK